MNLQVMAPRTLAQRFWSFDGQESEGLRYAATVSIWVRWCLLAACLVEISYRVEYGALSHILNSLYVSGFIAANGYVWWKIRTSGRVDPRWLLALSAMDVAMFSFTMFMSGGFDSRYFSMYYFAVALFAWVFTSPYLVFSWTTMVVAIYVGICLMVGDGVDFGQMEEKELYYRVLAMYGVAVSVNLIIRFERVRRLAAVGREREAVQREQELNRQRIEMSQTIHDTTAQSAYTLGLGLEDAIEKAEPLDPELARKLEAMWAVSRSAMWVLRQPIDGGEIFSGSTLGEVLAGHADTFTVIASIPAELVQRGVEPELSTIQRSLLFSIAHNALTNAFRHSEADSVTISLGFGEDALRLAVSDDGTGLPEDYAVRGHGFRNMGTDAERMGGWLEVESDGNGTTVSCTVPYERSKG